jgi:hypothetical protein
MITAAGFASCQAADARLNQGKTTLSQAAKTDVPLCRHTCDDLAFWITLLL